jgi:hypothetical protein
MRDHGQLQASEVKYGFELPLSIAHMIPETLR